MIPVLHNLHHYETSDFRIVPAPVLPLPPNHVLLYCLCPCGTHRTHFSVHRNVLLNHLLRSQAIHGRRQSQVQRLAQMHLQLRIRRLISRKEPNEMILTDSEEEDVDR